MYNDSEDGGAELAAEIDCEFADDALAWVLLGKTLTTVVICPDKDALDLF